MPENNDSSYHTTFQEIGTQLEIPEGTRHIVFHSSPDENLDEIHGEQFRNAAYLALIISDSGELDVQSSDRSFGSGYENGTFFISTNGVIVYFESDNSPRSTSSTKDKIKIDPMSKIRVIFGDNSRTNQQIHVPSDREYPEYSGEGWHLLHTKRRSLKIAPGYSARTITSNNDARNKKIRFSGLTLEHDLSTSVKPTNKRPPRKLTVSHPTYSHDGYRYQLCDDDTVIISLKGSRNIGWIFVNEIEAPTEETLEVQEIDGLRFIDDKGKITILDKPEADENFFAGIGSHLMNKEHPTLHIGPARIVIIKTLYPGGRIQLNIENSSQGDSFILVSIDGIAKRFKMNTEQSVIDLGITGLSLQVAKTEDLGLQIHLQNNTQDTHPFLATVKERKDGKNDNEDVSDIDTL